MDFMCCVVVWQELEYFHETQYGANDEGYSSGSRIKQRKIPQSESVDTIFILSVDENGPACTAGLVKGL